MTSQEEHPHEESAEGAEETVDTIIVPGLCSDISGRANIRFTEAITDSTDDELLFTCNTYQGVEVEQIRLVVDPEDLQPQRGEVDLMADFKEIIVREPTSFARDISQFELPDLLVTLIPKKSDGAEATPPSNGEVSVSRKQVTIAIFDRRATEISFDPALVREATRVEVENIHADLTPDGYLIDLMREENGVDLNFDVFSTLTYEGEAPEDEQTEILDIDGEALIAALHEVFDADEIIERYGVVPWFVELPSNVKPLLTMIRQYMASGKLVSQVDHLKQIGHEEPDTGQDS